MTTCEALAPLLVSRPLGLLEPEGEALVLAHLLGCGACQSFAGEVDQALVAASLPEIEAGDPAGDPPGWAALSARLATRPGPRRWLPAVALLLAGSVVGAAALWPAPAAVPPAPPPRVAPAPPPSEVQPPVSETQRPVSETAPPPGRAPQSSEPAPPPLPRADSSFTDIDGRVVAIEDEDEVRVRLSVGVDDGVQRGQRFAITRGGVLVGEVVVESVQRDSCACGIVSLEPSGSYRIRVGDASGLPPH